MYITKMDILPKKWIWVFESSNLSYKIEFVFGNTDTVERLLLYYQFITVLLSNLYCTLLCDCFECPGCVYPTSC